MLDRDSVINDLNVAKLTLCNPQMLTPEMCIRIGQAITSALVLLKEQSQIVRCKDCAFYTDSENCPVFGMDRYDDWFCADGERKEDKTI